ncbi:MAG: DNA topoisomerase 3 [Muribaculaceae bacterium]|nr:DNA topoisomerase 3 [Muribaculaceae bacterium]
MILCITEKPSVGKTIADVLGATIRRDGYFEGPEYCVTWTFGHLCTLKEPADYTPAWQRWSLSSLPMIPPRFGIKVIPQASIKRQFETIEGLIRQCERIINCGDAGQEGEVIQRWVMQKAGCDKPVERLWISSLTDEAIREGFKHLRPHKELESLYTAGLCRAIGDWILGINATRLYSLKYGTDRNLLSIGRVQTPTLAMVVNRQHEIENFVPKDTFELRTIYRGVTFSTQLDPFETQEAGAAVPERLKASPFTVTEVSRKKGREFPPRLFDLTALQVEANKRLNMGAEETLRTIQSLYEKKLATYPRVDTTYLTDDIYPKCGPILNSLTQYSELLQPLRGSKLRKSKKVFDNSKVTDHHAIIPTGIPLPQGLSRAEYEVFDLIARRFISVFYPDMEYDQTIVKGTVKDTPADVEFKASGRVIMAQGWKAVYARDKDPERENKKESESEQTELPPFKRGETGPHEPHLVKKTSKPPKYFDEGSLLKAMETAGSTVEDEDLREALKANGLGRPSTRSAIIEVLYKRGYIEKCGRQGKTLRATKAGIDLIGIINEELLKSAKLTGIWEGRLRAIERGEYSADEFIARLKEMISQITLSVFADNSGKKIS